jgi:REP-associated tyrosine transposase
MARPRRAVQGGCVYHVFNRGSRKGVIFDSFEEYRIFEQLIDAARGNRPMRIIAYQQMPTHFHFLLWPQSDEDISRFMKWLTGTHARRWNDRRHSRGCGAVYQSRYKAVLIESEQQYYNTWRYIERNALTAGHVTRAEDWRWGSAWQAVASQPTLSLDPGPLPRPDYWLNLVNA